MSAIRSFLDQQQRLSLAFDRAALPAEYGIDGSSQFFPTMVAPRLFREATVYDVGAGRRASIPISLKRELRLRVVGLDISASELSLAPPGSYDDAITADATSYRGAGDADFVICETLLEHVADTAAAFRTLHSILRPGGMLLLFVPSRRAAFAQLNLLLPEATKRRLLATIDPKTVGKQGFPAYYDKCTPGQFRTMAAAQGFTVDEVRLYWKSAYFTYLAPVHIAWRGWLLSCRAILGDDAAETFSMALRKNVVGAHAGPGPR